MKFAFHCARGGAPLMLTAALLLLAACASDPDLPGEPSFYRSLATKDAEVDSAARPR